MSDVLVLNSNFFAIQVTDWQRALTLVLLRHAVVVDQEYNTYSFEDWKGVSEAMDSHPAGFIHTPAFRIAIPEVIALKFFDQVPTQEVTFNRRNIYTHYGYRCCYCARKLPASELNLDHVLPKSRGGKTDWSNVVTSCIKCNLKKGSRLPEEAGMKLLKTPSKPKWRPRVSLMVRSPLRIRASWQRFIDGVYWDAELQS